MSALVQSQGILLLLLPGQLIFRFSIILGNEQSKFPPRSPLVWYGIELAESTDLLGHNFQFLSVPLHSRICLPIKGRKERNYENPS